MTLKRILLLPIAATIGLTACGETAKTPVAPERTLPPAVVAGPRMTHVAPIFTEGNKTCSQLGYGEFELKVEPVADGTYSDGILSVTIDVRITAQGQVFDFTSNIGIDAVFVKGGPDGNLYVYDPPAETKTDDGLHSPPGPNGNWAGLSHISFCYDVTPSVKIDKTGDALSKIGDGVTFTFTVTNDGELPLTLTSLTDDVLGDLADDAPAACDALAIGASCTFTVAFTIPAGSPDPHVNTATAVYGSAKGSVTHSDSHSINLFQPSLTLGKTGDAYSKIGDAISYTITLTNTSSADSPDLVCTIVDPIAGVNKTVTVASGGTNVTNASHTVVAGDPDPLVNTATATCSPQGFPNVLTQVATATTDLLQPSYTITKECVNSPVPAGQPAQFRVTLTNTGTADLVFAVTDASMPSINGTYAIAVGGAAVVLTGSIAVPAGATSVPNTVNVKITLATRYGLSNEYNETRSASCAVPQQFEGCTPGGWRNANGRLQLWNQTTDALSIQVSLLSGVSGFYSGMSFNLFFNLTVSQSGYPNGFTMLDGINAGGGGPDKLARHSVAAVLNIAAGQNYMYPPGTSSFSTLYAAIRTAYITDTYEPLASQLDAANNQGCTVPTP